MLDPPGETGAGASKVRSDDGSIWRRNSPRELNGLAKTPVWWNCTLGTVGIQFRMTTGRWQEYGSTFHISTRHIVEQNDKSCHESWNCSMSIGNPEEIIFPNM